MHAQSFLTAPSFIAELDRIRILLVAFEREPVFEVGHEIEARSSCESRRIPARIWTTLEATSMIRSWSSASEHRRINEMVVLPVNNYRPRKAVMFAFSRPFQVASVSGWSYS